jgi:hypothetical protein
MKNPVSVDIINAILKKARFFLQLKSKKSR